MRVRAKIVTKGFVEKPKVVGYFNGTRVREGEEFEIEDESLFSKIWMEKVEEFKEPSRPKRQKMVNEVERVDPNVGVI